MDRLKHVCTKGSGTITIDESDRWLLFLKDGPEALATQVNFCPWCGIDLKDFKRAVWLQEKASRPKAKRQPNPASGNEDSAT